MPRVRCPGHGVVVAAVPWARHGAGHTRFFDDQVAWLAVACSKTAVMTLMRVAWRTVGAIVTRVGPFAADAIREELDRDDESVGLRRILDTVLDGYELDGEGWLELTKNVTDGSVPA